MIIRYGRSMLEVPPGTELGGYAARNEPSDGILDPLELQVLTVESGGDAWSLVVGDLVCVNRDLAAAVRAVDGLAGQATWLHATHTHASPELGCVPGGTATPAGWLDRIVAETQLAASGQKPLGEAVAVASRVWVDGVGGPRNERAGSPLPVDLLAFRDEHGDLLAALVIVPVHPTVLPASNHSVSADLPGAVRAVLRERLGCEAVLVATGAAGNISTRSTRRGQGAPELRRLGGIVADAVANTLAAATSQSAWHDLVRTASIDTALPRKTAAVADALHRTAVAEQIGDHLSGRSREVLRQAIAQPYHPGTHTAPVPVEIAAARIGDLTLVALPCEPYLEVGEAIRARERCLVLGYTNGYAGYLPTREAAMIPTYESLVSPFAENAADGLAAATRALLERDGRR